MSTHYESERAEYYDKLKKEAYEEAGLIHWEGKEWVGTKEKWKKAEDLLEIKLENQDVE